ncbi:hypothetical protein TrRE_jg7124 [Triparma retinervis]|uniref:Rho-GAP domain-containing protein n=1 Tax=Triparma retinervis TaxID=2557542 RepID=A0A9W7DXN8_9STRA|nr:hypothetical protein TrRE_jg7124 [Triparma retinervis]
MSARVLPNPLLRECVLNHSNRRRFRPDAVGGLAFFVFQRIVMGDGGGEIEGDVVELGEEDVEDIEGCYVPEGVWGETLEGVLRKELFTRNATAAMPPPGQLMGDYKTGVPVILSLLTAAVDGLGGGEVEGIFRLAALKDDVDWIREEIRGGDYRAIMSGSLEGYDVLADLDPAARACVDHLCGFLKRLSGRSGVTKMTTGNLALVFAPNLIKNPSEDPRVFAMHAESEKRFVAMLIEAQE